MLELSKIGQSIKQARKRAKLTQQELAEKIGKTESSIRKYEKGLTQIPIAVVDKIATVLNVPIIQLIPDIIWSEHKNTKEMEKIEVAVNSFDGFLAVLRDIYGVVEEKNVYIADNGEIPYWLIGEGENVFILYENDIDALRDSVKGLLPPLVEKMKDARTEQEIIEELTALLNEKPPE